jgi:hypothetical protein
MNANLLRIIFITFCFALLVQVANFADTPSLPTTELEPGTASGKLKVDIQTFKMNYAYVRRIEKDDESKGQSYLVLITNRKFPYDLSKLTRFEIGKYMERYDLNGIDIGIDEQQNLTFIDVLRAPVMIIDAQFAPGDRKQGQVAGRVYTNGEVRYFGKKVKFDIKFNAKLQP